MFLFGQTTKTSVNTALDHCYQRTVKKKKKSMIHQFVQRKCQKRDKAHTNAETTRVYFSFFSIFSGLLLWLPCKKNKNKKTPKNTFCFKNHISLDYCINGCINNFSTKNKFECMSLEIYCIHKRPVLLFITSPCLVFLYHCEKA